MSQRPQGRTLKRRALNGLQGVWNGIRGPMQRQSTKDAELIKSVNNGDYNRVLKYLKRGANVNAVDEHQYTPMVLAVRIPDYNIARLLLTKNPVLNHEVFEELGHTIFRYYHGDEQDLQKHTTAVRFYRELVYKLPFDQRITQIDELHFRERQNREFQTTERRDLEGNIAQTRAAAQEQLNLGRSPENARSIFTRRNELRMRANRGQQSAIDELWELDAPRREANARAEAARRAADNAANLGVLEPGAEISHVHRQAAKFSGKVPAILEVIKRDLGNPSVEMYEDIEAVFDRTLGKYIKESPDFESKAINSIQVNKANGTKGPKILSRDEWIQDLERVKQGVLGANLLKKIQMGMIFDFIIEHKELTECFIAAFVHDCTHAYANGHLSCFPGIMERTVSTLINCMKGMNEGVYGELNKIIEGEKKTWDSLSDTEKEAYKSEWARFYQKWATDNKDTLKSTPWTARIEALMTAYGATVPAHVLEGIKILNPSDQIKSALELDYDYEDPVAAGGRRRKSKRTRRR